MTGIDEVAEFLDEVGARLDAGAREYGDQSFVRPLAETERQILEESIDQVGWLYVLWCQATRKTDMVRDQAALRQLFRERVDHRIRRNDRRNPVAAAHDRSALGLVADLEILAVDLFAAHMALARRLRPLVRSLEVTAALPARHLSSGRRGGMPDPRSSD